MLGTLVKIAAGGAATAIGVAIGKDAVTDIKRRYKRAKLRRELAKARGEDKMPIDELEDLKRKLEDSDDGR